MRRKSFFTLLEMLIVLSLVAVVASGMVFPCVKRIRQQRFYTGCEQVIDLLNTAQKIALIYKENATLEMRFSEGKLLCQIVSDLEVHEPLRKRIHKQRQIAGIASVAFFDEEQGKTLEHDVSLAFKKGYSPFPKGKLVLTASRGSTKVLYLPGHPHILLSSFDQSVVPQPHEAETLYPKRVMVSTE